MPFPPIKFKNDKLELLDQRKLPRSEKWMVCADSRRVHWAIKNMVVRGAPAIGVAGGYGLYLGVKRYKGTHKGFLKKMKREADYLISARPTGVNLHHVINAICARIRGAAPTATVEKLKSEVLKQARFEHRRDDDLCRSIGRHGARLFRSGDRILTHCNAGGLATTGYGTALGVLYALKQKKKKFSVFVDETRPLLQGARLTAWELVRSRIPCTVLCDNAAASLFQSGQIDRVIVGADRIAGNGDAANKIGTYNVAVLARAHKVPFYIAAPMTTFDFSIASGKQIPIESRNANEVSQGFGKKTTPAGANIKNPAFDVTPHGLITAFITEAGVLRPPYGVSFRKIKKALKSFQGRK